MLISTVAEAFEQWFALDFVKWEGPAFL